MAIRSNVKRRSKRCISGRQLTDFALYLGLIVGDAHFVEFVRGLSRFVLSDSTGGRVVSD
jgi:hypothetical protein